MFKILVTGSNGLLGQKLSSLILKDKDCELIATSKGDNRFCIKEGYTYVDLDITNEIEVIRITGTLMPDVIINTAAVTQVDVCERDKKECENLNVSSVATLIKICEKLNIRLIHLSTDFVFDGKSGPYSEDALPNPLSYYGETKLNAEKYLMRSSCKWTIVRTVLVYGVLKEMSRSNVVLWAKSALDKGEHIKVVSDQWRTPTLAEDLAIGCLLIAKKSKTGIYNISGKEMMSILQLVETVADFWQLDKSTISPVLSAMLNEAPRPKKTGFLIDKAETELGYKPHSFIDGLRVLDEQLSLNSFT